MTDWKLFCVFRKLPVIMVMTSVIFDTAGYYEFFAHIKTTYVKGFSFVSLCIKLELLYKPSWNFSKLINNLQINGS